MKVINFNEPFISDNQIDYFNSLLLKGKFCGDGFFTNQCSKFLEEKFNFNKVLLTTSCTDALELISLLIDIKPDDEVIMPSFTFVSTANAFLLRGAKIVFIDLDDEFNININLLNNAINIKTKAIISVHYAGTSSNIDKISEIAKSNNIFLIEDAAQAINSFYNNKPLGKFGDFSTFSFHETKNIHCGEGGALCINNSNFIEKAEIIREKGTDRKNFLKGLVDKYTWREIGSSYLISELNASFLNSQLYYLDYVTLKRKSIWDHYFINLIKYTNNNSFYILNHNSLQNHNAHIFALILPNYEIRNSLMSYLKSYNIHSAFHYIPLHSSPQGLRHCKFIYSNYDFSTNFSERLLRLPLHTNLSNNDIDFIIKKIKDFFNYD
jgi:dTDP-4-amino-4,6-dideoxygalactose transaminase